MMGALLLHERYLIKPTDALSSCYSYESLQCVLVSWLISCTFGLHSHLRPLVTPLHSRSPRIHAQLCTLRTSVGVAMAAPMLPAVAPATSFFQNGSPPSAQTHIHAAASTIALVRSLITQSTARTFHAVSSILAK